MPKRSASKRKSGKKMPPPRKPERKASPAKIPRVVQKLKRRPQPRLASAPAVATPTELPPAPLAVALPPNPAVAWPRSHEQIATWEDDPESEGARRINVDIPGNPLSQFGINILWNSPPPPKAYEAGTAEARYWTAREALVRGRDFWKPLMPDDSSGWQMGGDLPVNLNAGVQLNAFYNRFNGLTFYRDREDGRDIYTAENPEIVCHELGHAILDSLQPALWFAATFETAAFHEAFGDISALLAGLHQSSLCAHVLERNGPWIERDSRWTRIGEALGKALNHRDPDRASPQCLRNAANSFYYQPPSKLATSGPDSQLTREPHSLSRPVVGAFLQILGGLARAGGATPTVESVQDTAWKAGLWMVSAIRNAPVQPDYFFQIASALVVAAMNSGTTEERDVVASAFVRRGILPVEALDQGWPNQPPPLPTGAVVVSEAVPAFPAAMGLGTAGAASAAATAADAETSIRLDGSRVGFKSVIKLSKSKTHYLPRQKMFYQSILPPPLAAAAAKLGISALEPVFGAAPAAAPIVTTTPQNAPVDHDEEFVHYLFQRGRVEFDEPCAKMAATGKMFARKTHRLTMKDGEPTLERICFDCGFD